MKRRQGFALIELMVVLGVIGILFSIALPIYRDYVKKATRTAAGVVLMDVVSRQDQYAATNRAYATDLASLGIVPPTEVSASYTFTIEAKTWSSGTVTMNGYLVTAAPVVGGSMDGDISLSVNQYGMKMPVGTW